MSRIYTEEQREIRRERTRRWQREHPAFCQTCSKPIHPQAQFCREHTLRSKREHNPRWKGGRMMKEGYVLLLKPEHPRANKGGYVREHIFVWEQTHNKPLPKGWIIHHLNGIKDDNRPTNLIGLPNKKHYLVLRAKAKRIQELEALLNHQHQLL